MSTALVALAAAGIKVGLLTIGVLIFFRVKLKYRQIILLNPLYLVSTSCWFSVLIALVNVLPLSLIDKSCNIFIMLIQHVVLTIGLFILSDFLLVILQVAQFSLEDSHQKIIKIIQKMTITYVFIFSTTIILAINALDPAKPFSNFIRHNSTLQVCLLTNVFNQAFIILFISISMGLFMFMLMLGVGVFLSMKCVEFENKQATSAFIKKRLIFTLILTLLTTTSIVSLKWGTRLVNVQHQSNLLVIPIIMQIFQNIGGVILAILCSLQKERGGDDDDDDDDDVTSNDTLNKPPDDIKSTSSAINTQQQYKSRQINNASHLYASRDENTCSNETNHTTLRLSSVVENSPHSINKTDATTKAPSRWTKVRSILNKKTANDEPNIELQNGMPNTSTSPNILLKRGCSTNSDILYPPRRNNTIASFNLLDPNFNKRAAPKMKETNMPESILQDFPTVKARLGSTAERIRAKRNKSQSKENKKNLQRSATFNQAAIYNVSNEAIEEHKLGANASKYTPKNISIQNNFDVIDDCPINMDVDILESDGDMDDDDYY